MTETFVEERGTSMVTGGLDVSSAIPSGDNTVTIIALSRLGGTATILIADGFLDADWGPPPPHLRGA